MQFKNPELLWALLLLLIPIIIHLFQLRRFKKTPFTNVKFLKKVVSESRRSNTLKKWLLLLTRLFLLTALILAFAQPFFAGTSALLEKETVIYLDDSYSMQAKSDGDNLLDNAIQELLKSAPKQSKFTLFTNERVYHEVFVADIQNELLAMRPTTTQLNLDEIRLKANTFFTKNNTSVKHLILLSDLQQRMAGRIQDTTDNVLVHIVPLSPDLPDNVSLDTIYRNEFVSDNIELTVLVSSNTPIESVPVSLYNGEKLIAKTAAVFGVDQKAKVNFTLPTNEVINGKLEISDGGLNYDNQLFFNIGAHQTLKVLVVEETQSDFLGRIFTPDEFEWSHYPLKNLNYPDIALHNLLILNELPAIPASLTANIKSFTENGGTLVVIPASEIDLSTYNQLLANYFATNLTQKVAGENNITNITFSHPVFQNVFEKQVVNFEYPKVSDYYRLKTKAPSLLSFQDGNPFLVGADNAYFFTAPLSIQHSNFINSPLVVPTFYNMGVQSLKAPNLYAVLGKTTVLDVNVTLSKDHILKVSKGQYEFIPQQRSMANKVTLTFDGNLDGAGIYRIHEGENIIRNIGFNDPRAESDLSYLNPDRLEGSTISPSIESLFQEIEKDNSITALWKWFIILALLLLLVEILIQKYLT